MNLISGKIIRIVEGRDCGLIECGETGKTYYFHYSSQDSIGVPYIGSDVKFTLYKTKYDHRVISYRMGGC